MHAERDALLPKSCVKYTCIFFSDANLQPEIKPERRSQASQQITKKKREFAGGTILVYFVLVLSFSVVLL